MSRKIEPDILGACPECGADCVDSPSGVVCMNGHGGVEPVAPRKTKAAAIEVGQLLDKALEIAKNAGDPGWVTAWAISQPELEGYGYTVEIQERAEAAEEKVQELEELLEDFHPAPRLTHLADSMKMEYFLEHFQEIPLEALEWFVREVRTK